MRIRKQFAAGFAGVILVAGYLGLAPLSLPQAYHSDKVLHFVTFFILTILFYWSIDTTRRRLLHLTLTVCTLCLGIGSEFLQEVLPNKRTFDRLDILANVLGSLAALSICAWYHKRMLERRRAAKGFAQVPQTDPDLEAGVESHELAEGTGPQESGVTHSSAARDEDRDITQELDEWDENEEDDWDDQEVVKEQDRDKKGANGTVPVKRDD